MDAASAERAVTAFNDCINARDLAGVARWMTDDHCFIDTAANVVSGKSACIEAWRGFFATFPDYRNVFATMRVRGDMVAIAGHSECADARLDGPALWTARLAGDGVAEWRVYEDNAANRAQIGL